MLIIVPIATTIKVSIICEQGETWLCVNYYCEIKYTPTDRKSVV